jgi:ankyrin repeat protein
MSVSSDCLPVNSSDEDEVAKLLLDHGAKINVLNGKGATPLIIAAVKGHYSVLRILANHPDIRIHEQVCRASYKIFFAI